MTSVAKPRQKLLTDPQVQAVYDRPGPIYAVVCDMIDARLAAASTRCPENPAAQARSPAKANG